MSILNINSMYVQCTYFEIENRHGIDKDFQAVSPFFEVLFIIFNFCIQYFDIIFSRVDDKLYGRGSTDDKGPVLGWLHVIQVSLLF